MGRTNEKEKPETISCRALKVTNTRALKGYVPYLLGPAISEQIF
jgi:hypothetical protein